MIISTIRLHHSVWGDSQRYLDLASQTLFERVSREIRRLRCKPFISLSSCILFPKQTYLHFQRGLLLTCLLSYHVGWGGQSLPLGMGTSQRRSFCRQALALLRKIYSISIRTACRAKLEGDNTRLRAFFIKKLNYKQINSDRLK